jgi:uncharacterized protein (DUF2225 family)
MSLESPIYRMRIECPICRNENEFEALKVGSYTESGRDSDFRPTGRTWRNPEYQHLDPLYYSVATCTTCYYTRELDGSYKNWSRDKRFTLYRQKALREAHLVSLAEPQGVLKTLGSHLDLAKHPRTTTINKLLLGIFDEQITDGGDRLNVARYYLRVAWMFRDLGESLPESSGASQAAATLKQELFTLKNRFESALEQARELAVTLSRGPGADLEPEAQVARLNQSCTAMLAQWQAVTEASAELEPRSSALNSSAAPFFEYPDHRTFLEALRSKWHEVPRSEAEALERALDHYIAYFEHSRSFTSPEQEVQTAYLIAELGRRVGRSREASGYFNHAIRKGHELIHEYQQDPQRSGYLRKLVELSVEQGKKNRHEQEIEAEV